jgi:hypothetical protein
VNYHPHLPRGESGEESVDRDQFEFVELQNVGRDPINMFGSRFVDGFDFTFGNLSIEPGQAVVVVRDLDAFQTRYDTSNVIIAGEFTRGALANGGERIKLVGVTGETIGDFTYDDSGHWPQSADGAGATLQIVDVMGDYSDPGNWQASKESGGSPGRGEIREGSRSRTTGNHELTRLQIVGALQAGKYLTAEKATSEEGDWNGDGLFDQLDIIVALAGGTKE